ncbi:MAG: hypothetical protein Q8M16_11520 [Pirellulaceae bacterium]|nr:hypothetical protein [Pirellulaceae bacterium]
MFTIQCGSCRAKLKVAKLELIGQSLGCPRCGSMVLVEPPPGWEPPSDANIVPTKVVDPSQQPVAKRRRDQSVPTADSPQDLQETLPNVGSLGWGEELKLVDVDPELSGANRQVAAGQAAPRATGANARPAGNRPTTPKNEKAIADGLLRPENWDSARTRQRRTILLSVMAGFGLLMLFGTLGYYWWNQQARLAELEKAPTKQPLPGETDNKSNPTESNKNGDAAAKVEEPIEKDSGPGNQNPIDPDVLPPGEDPVVPNPNENVAPNPGPDQSDQAADGNGAEAQPPVQSPDEMGIGGTEDGAADGGFQDVMKSILEDGLTSEWDDPGLRKMTQAGLDPIDEVLRKFAERQPTRSRSPRVVKPLPREVDTQRGLTAKIAGLRHEQGRVPQLMSIAETLSGLPIWIDIPRFEGQPVALDSTRLVEAVQTTIPELLVNQMEPFGLAAEQHAWNPERPAVFGFRVFPRDSDKMMATTHSVDWLAADLSPDALQTELQKVGKFLSEYVGRRQWGEMAADAESNPEAQRATQVGAWQIRDGKILVVHYPHIQNQLARVLRQLTLAKSNQGQPQNWPEELLPKAVQESGRLQTVINLQSHQPVPLRDIFQQIYKQSNVTVVVDWPSLIAEGWTPDTVVPIVVENQVVADVLQELSLDMGLSVRQLAPDVVSLLSDSAEEQYSNVEVYPVADLCPSTREWPILGSRLNRLLEQDFNRYQSAYLYYDPDFKSIVARMPQSSHRRLHVYLRAARRP